MKKKIAGLLVAAVMVTSALVGCGTNTAETEAAETNAAVEANTVEDNAVAEGTEAAEVIIESGDGVLVVGFDQDFPPMGFVGASGEFEGFDLDLAAEVANRLGKEVQYQPIAWDAKDMELESGNIDCVWNGFTINGREDKYTWTDAYMNNSQVFVVKGDSGITTPADLAGKVVEVQMDSSGEAAIEAATELVASFQTLTKVADYNTAFMDLESGAADAIVMDDIVASYQIEQRDANFVILEEALAPEEYGVGFKLGNEELRDQVQAALEEMAADGTMAEISNKWFAKDITIIGK